MILRKEKGPVTGGGEGCIFPGSKIYSLSSSFPQAARGMKLGKEKILVNAPASEVGGK